MFLSPELESVLSVTKLSLTSAPLVSLPHANLLTLMGLPLCHWHFSHLILFLCLHPVEYEFRAQGA